MRMLKTPWLVFQDGSGGMLTISLQTLSKRPLLAKPVASKQSSSTVAKFLRIELPRKEVEKHFIRTNRIIEIMKFKK